MGLLPVSLSLESYRHWLSSTLLQENREVQNTTEGTLKPHNPPPRDKAGCHLCFHHFSALTRTFPQSSLPLHPEKLSVKVSSSVVAACVAQRLGRCSGSLSTAGMAPKAALFILFVSGSQLSHGVRASPSLTICIYPLTGVERQTCSSFHHLRYGLLPFISKLTF